MDFIEPCFGIGHNLSLICQMTSEDIKHQLIIGGSRAEGKTWMAARRHAPTRNDRQPAPEQVTVRSDLFTPLIAVSRAVAEQSYKHGQCPKGYCWGTEANVCPASLYESPAPPQSLLLISSGLWNSVHYRNNKMNPACQSLNCWIWTYTENEITPPATGIIP